MHSTKGRTRFGWRGLALAAVLLATGPPGRTSGRRRRTSRHMRSPAPAPQRGARPHAVLHGLARAAHG